MEVGGGALLPSNSRILLWYDLGLKEGCSHWHLEGFCPSWLALGVLCGVLISDSSLWDMFPALHSGFFTEYVCIYARAV